MNLRGILVTGRQIIRATLPVSTVPTSQTTSLSGLGDLNVFDAIVVTGPDAATMIGVGPLLVAPTATDAALGADDTWQAGAAAVVVGVGKVLPLGGAIVNAFVEPQVTVYHKGQGLPSLQVFLGINFQFPKR